MIFYLMINFQTDIRDNDEAALSHMFGPLLAQASGQYPSSTKNVLMAACTGHCGVQGSQNVSPCSSFERQGVTYAGDISSAPVSLAPLGVKYRRCSTRQTGDTGGPGADPRQQRATETTAGSLTHTFASDVAGESPPPTSRRTVARLLPPEPDLRCSCTLVAIQRPGNVPCRHL